MHPQTHPKARQTVKLVDGREFEVADWADRFGFALLDLEKDAIYGRFPNGCYKIIQAGEIAE